MDRVANTIARLINLLTPNESPRTRRLDSGAINGIARMYRRPRNFLCACGGSHGRESDREPRADSLYRIRNRVLHYPRVARTTV